MSRRVLPETSPHRTEYYSRRLTDLTNVLSDTNENIKEIDAELAKSRHQRGYNSDVRSRRQNDDYYYQSRKSYNQKRPMKSSLSDNEDDSYSNSNRHKNKHNVVFRDDLNESLHELHQQVRDMSFEQDKLADKLEFELRHKYKTDDDVKKWSNDSHDSMDKRVEKRLNNAYEKLKGEENIRNEVKTALDEFRKVSKDELTSLKLAMAEADKQKVHGELVATKSRLNEIEESKSMLANQVQHLKDQLNKFESSRFGHLHTNNNEINAHCKCHHESDYDLMKSKYSGSGGGDKYHDSTSDVVRAIEKYEKQKDMLSDQNLSLKKLLEEKENKENQILLELKFVNEKVDKYEKQNNKLQMDLEIALSKLQEITQEAEKYANGLRAAEEQLNMSEFKRNELKKDAQETVKLWKTKVKKLEKSVDKYRTDSIHLSEQNELLKAQQNNHVLQLENKLQELSNLKDMTANLEEKLNVKDMELNHLKTLCDELRSQNDSFKSGLNEIRVNSKQYENRVFGLQTEKSDLERQLLLESEKYRDLCEKFTTYEIELSKVNNERKSYEMHIAKLEQEIQRLKSNLNSVEKAGYAAKTDLNSISMQALHNKENYDEKMSKMNKEVQKCQFQLQKAKLECEDSIRLVQVQLAEERSKIELFKKRENDYLKEIDELKEAKRKLEDELNELQTNYEKLARNDNDKNRQLLDFEEKINKLIADISEQKNLFYSKESEYWQILNTLNVDIDLLTGLLTTHSNELYKPISVLDETEKDKPKSFYLFMKSKLNWLGKEVEVRAQKEYKLQQNINYLEGEIDKLKKKSLNTIISHGLSLQKLENENNNLEVEKSLALKNMELLQSYLINLGDSLKTHSLKEIERTHHLIAVDNVLNICNNENYSQVEKDEIFERFKQNQ